MRIASFLVLASSAAACGPAVPAEPGVEPPPTSPCDEFCDPLQGLHCDLDTGRCRGPCAPEELGPSYVGCDYYPTVTGNEVNGRFEFAVSVSNVGSEAATVTIEWGALDGPLTFDVDPGRVETRRLPWVADLKGCLALEGIECSAVDPPRSAYVPKGAYRLRSTRPVIVYQFNPLDYALDGDRYSYTNDASLLLPVNALGVQYVAASWPAVAGARVPSLLAITATADDTTVTVTPRADVDPGAAPVASAGVPYTISMRQGDVLELMSGDGDLTGSTVSSDRPVQVIAGHFCTFIPSGVGWCDHLEESMFPVQTLSRRYLVAAPAVPSLPDGKARIVRIVAIHDDTTVAYDPSIAAPTYLARAGETIEIDGDLAYEIHADRRILVAEYMKGQEAGGEMGDPAMTLAVPVEQYRLDYLFHAPTNYETSYVNVIAPIGATVTLDGRVVDGFVPIGATEFALARVTLDAGVDGNHSIAGDLPIGITVYGYGQYTSYWYPGGLDLHPVVVE